MASLVITLTKLSIWPCFSKLNEKTNKYKSTFLHFTSVICPSNSLPPSPPTCRPPASLHSLPKQPPPTVILFSRIDSIHLWFLFSWIHDMSWASTVACLNPLSCHQWLWTTGFVLKCNKGEFYCRFFFYIFEDNFWCSIKVVEMKTMLTWTLLDGFAELY